MPRFAISGWIGGLPAGLQWEDGELSGTTDAIARVEELVAAGETLWATPTGPHFTASTTKPEPALVTCSSVFDEIAEIEGDVAIAADVPKGATP